MLMPSVNGASNTRRNLQVSQMFTADPGEWEVSKQRSKGQPDQFSVEVCHFLFLLFTAQLFFPELASPYDTFSCQILDRMYICTPQSNIPLL